MVEMNAAYSDQVEQLWFIQGENLGKIGGMYL